MKTGSVNTKCVTLMPREILHNFRLYRRLILKPSNYLELLVRGCMILMASAYCAPLELRGYCPYLRVMYWSWCLWVISSPFFYFLLFPAIMAITLYIIALCLHVYKFRKKIKEAYSHTIWDGARYTVAAFFDGQGKLWHGR